MSDCSDDEAVTDKQLKVVIVGDGASGKVIICSKCTIGSATTIFIPLACKYSCN